MSTPISTGIVAAAVTPPVAQPVEAAGREQPSDQIEQFMARVVAWPGQDGPGFVNLHWQAPDNRKGGFRGRPFKTLQEFMDLAQRAATNPGTFKEIYFCLSTQRTVGRIVHGAPIAHRDASQVLDLKALWIDVDVKPEKGYATIDEAMAAITAFVVASNLPVPSAIVFSGGGVHVYWISDRPLTEPEWRPFAEGLRAEIQKHGLKCDAGLTTDSVRVLRVPGTLNNKIEGQPRPVLLKCLGESYDFAASPNIARLATIVPVKVQSKAVTAAVTIRAAGLDPALAAKFPLNGMHPMLAAVLDPVNDNLATGLNNHSDLPLNPDEVIKGCAHFQDCAVTRGAKHGQGLWALTLLASTFFEDGRRWAHYFSKGYPAYNHAETEAKFDEKLTYKAERNLGWPSCKAFEGEGAKCNSCPFYDKIKSPLNLASRLAPQTQDNPNSPTKQGSALFPSSGVSFRDLTRDGDPRPSLANAVIALRALGVEAWYDLFHRRINVKYKGQAHTIRDGLLTDDTVAAARSLTNNTYRIDCGEPNTLAAIKELAFDNAYDPILDLLDDCQGKWDQKKRLDTWVIDYLGCPDTPLNRAIGRKVLTGACRRARQPGCKFDTIPVLEGVEGTNKSTAIRVLAGDDNFSDQSILGAGGKEVQEQLDGVWMHENADLAGMRRAEVEQIKAFASRQADRARPAYGRVREDRPRRSIEWGTTNNKEYLLSQTGNRRFWPLETGKIEIEALERDREQLLGEAATYEAAGESVTLDQSLWPAARDAQEQRRAVDPWEDRLNGMPDGVVHRGGDGNERIATADVLLHVLQIPLAQQTTAHAQRLAHAMEHAGWTRNPGGRVTINGTTVRGYIRPVYCTASPTGPSGAQGPTAIQGMTGPAAGTPQAGASVVVPIGLTGAAASAGVSP